MKSQPSGRAVLGGSFDPVHIGHITMAKAALSALNISEVLLMPANIPPHKRYRHLAGPSDRLNMLRLATAPHARIGVTDIELARGGVSYTVDTLRLLRAEWDDTPITLLMGADTLLDLRNWKDPEEILHTCRIGIIQRPGYPMAEEEAERLRRAFGANIDFVLMGRLSVSSAMVRNAVAQGKSAEPWVGEAVWAYIRDHHLYTEDEYA